MTASSFLFQSHGVGAANCQPLGAHAFVGAILGDNTAQKGGQVTLNPFPHIKKEIVGTIFVPLVSFFLSGFMIGWASAPFSLQWAKSNPKKFAYMSFAGPAANLAIVLSILIITNIGYYLDILIAPDSINFSYITDSNLGGIASSITKFISILFSLNIMLFVFNMLPLPILDGGSIPLLFLKFPNTNQYIDKITDSRLVFPAIFIAWYIFEYVHDPVRGVFLNLLYIGTTYS